MFTTKVASAAALLVVLVGTAGCGGSSASSAASADGAGPTDASQSEFCAGFSNLTSDMTPSDAAEAFSKIGTPSNITADARKGYEVIMTRFRTMTGKARSSDLSSMMSSLSTTEQKQVAAFGVYLTQECPSVVPSAPAS
jgi:hypothetical protein